VRAIPHAAGRFRGRPDEFGNAGRGFGTAGVVGGKSRTASDDPENASDAGALANLVLADSGSYTVAVSNSAGTAVSSPALLTVTAVPFAGSYFGTLGGNAGTFALYIRGNNTAVLLAYARAAKLAFVGNNNCVGDDGGEKKNNGCRGSHERHWRR